MEGKRRSFIRHSSHIAGAFVVVVGDLTLGN